MKESYYLQSIYDARKSFGNKAIVEIENGKKTLLSYLTKVAEIENGKLTILNEQSMTTRRHIREFAKQNGFIY